MLAMAEVDGFRRGECERIAIDGVCAENLLGHPHARQRIVAMLLEGQRIDLDLARRRLETALEMFLVFHLQRHGHTAGMTLEFRQSHSAWRQDVIESFIDAAVPKLVPESHPQ